MAAAGAIGGSREIGYNRGQALRAAVMRCIELDRTGRQCPAEALEGTEFCAAHLRILEPDALESSPRRPYLYRLAAFLLLLIFLLNGYQALREWLGG